MTKLTPLAEPSARVAALHEKIRRNRGRLIFTCVCGQELLGDEDLRVVCCKCFGAFRPIDNAG
jgi:hypothetical protein